MTTNKGIMAYIVFMINAGCVVVLFRHLADSWQVNMGNMGVLEEVKETWYRDKYVQRKSTAMMYLDMVEKYSFKGHFRVAKAFWKSALNQKYHNTGDFLVRYRAHSLWLSLGEKGIPTNDIYLDLDIGRFRTDLIIKNLEYFPWPPKPNQIISLCHGLAHFPEIIVYIANSYMDVGWYEQARDLIIEVISHYSSDEEWPYLKLGQIYEDWAYGDVDSLSQMKLLNNAIKYYEKAYHLDQQQPFALAKLVEINESLEYQEEAKRWKSKFENQISKRSPKYYIGKEINPKWIVLGYDLKEELLGIDWTGPAPICVWWRFNELNEVPISQGFVVSDTLVQCYQATNLAVNGGFEFDARMGKLFPFGFESDWYEVDFNVPLDVHNLSPDPLGGWKGTIAWLSNTPSVRYTSFQSKIIPVGANDLFILSANVRGADSNAIVGNLWLRQDFYFHGYNYIVHGGSVNWKHWAGIAFPPKGTVATRIWLKNNNSDGAAFFDNVLFMKLRLPMAN